jgi:hypothetical protein
MSNQTESLEQASVRQFCRAVRVPTVAANFVSLAEQAVKENHSHIRYLEALLAIECEERDRHAIANRIRDTQLPRMKTLEEFDFAGAADPSGEDPRVGRRRLHRTERTGGADRGMWDRQEPPGDGTLPGGLPTKTAGAVHDSSGAGE